MAVSVKSPLGYVTTTGYYSVAPSANAWAQFTASTTSAIRVIGVTLTGASDLYLGTGAAASEVAFFYDAATSGNNVQTVVFPFPVRVPSGTRVAAKTSSSSSQITLHYVTETAVQ